MMDKHHPLLWIQSEHHKLESAACSKKTLIAWVQQFITDRLLNEQDVLEATNATTLINAHEISTTVYEQQTTSQTTASQE